MSGESATLQAIFDRLGQVQAEVGQVRVEVGQFQETVLDRFAQARAELGQIRAELRQVRAELDQVRAELRQVRAELDQVRAELSQVHVEQGQLRDELAKLDARVTQNHAEVMARIDKLQRELAVHIEARVVDFATGERAEKIARDTQAHLTALVSSISDQVNGMWRVIHHLQTEVRELRRGAS